MATLLLIPGAWHGSWCWDDVKPMLAARGHSVLTPDLPATDPDGLRWSGDVLCQWTDALAALVEARDEPCILVGHSRGGLLVSTVAERIPHHVTLAVYLSAPMLLDGEAAAEVGFLSHDTLAAFKPGTAPDTVAIDSSQASNLLYADVPPDVAEQAIVRLTEGPIQPSSAKMRVSADRFGRVPRAYIETTADRVALLSAQRAMQARWPCNSLVSLPCGHGSSLAIPKQLADALDCLAHESHP